LKLRIFAGARRSIENGQRFDRAPRRRCRRQAPVRVACRRA
jgi:hypothetical protein